MLFLGSRRSSQSRAVLASAWSAITFASPTSQGTNEDRAITWGGGARTITTNWASGGTLEYRLDSGSYVTYSGGFSMTSGQTLGWRYQAGGSNVNAASQVSVNGVVLASHNIIVTGY